MCEETQNGNATLASNMKMTTGDNKVRRSIIKTNLLVTDKNGVVKNLKKLLYFIGHAVLYVKLFTVL